MIHRYDMIRSTIMGILFVHLFNCQKESSTNIWSYLFIRGYFITPLSLFLWIVSIILSWYTLIHWVESSLVSPEGILYYGRGLEFGIHSYSLYLLFFLPLKSGSLFEIVTSHHTFILCRTLHHLYSVYS